MNRLVIQKIFWDTYCIQDTVLSTWDTVRYNGAQAKQGSCPHVFCWGAGD